MNWSLTSDRFFSGLKGTHADILTSVDNNIKQIAIAFIQFISSLQHYLNKNTRMSLIKWSLEWENNLIKNTDFFWKNVIVITHSVFIFTYSLGRPDTSCFFNALGTECKLNVHKTFRRRKSYVHSIYVLCPEEMLYIATKLPKRRLTIAHIWKTCSISQKKFFLNHSPKTYLGTFQSIYELICGNNSTFFLFLKRLWS